MRGVPPENPQEFRDVPRLVGQRKSTPEGISSERGTRATGVEGDTASCQAERRTGAEHESRPASMPVMPRASFGTSKRCPSGTVSAAPAAERWGLKTQQNRKWPGSLGRAKPQASNKRDAAVSHPLHLSPPSRSEGARDEGNGKRQRRNQEREEAPYRGPPGLGFDAGHFWSHRFKLPMSPGSVEPTEAGPET